MKVSLLLLLIVRLLLVLLLALLIIRRRMVLWLLRCRIRVLCIMEVLILLRSRNGRVLGVLRLLLFRLLIFLGVGLRIVTDGRG